MTHDLRSVLTKDLSCNPVDLRSDLHLEICKQAEKWQKQAENSGVDFRQAVQRAAGDILGTVQNPLTFDMKMIQAVGTQLEAAPQAARETFTKFAVDVAGHYRRTLSALVDVLPGNEIVNKAQEISETIGAVAHGIENWGRGISAVAAGAMRLPLPAGVQECLVKVQGLTGSVANVAREVGGVLDNLWAKTTATVGHADQLNTQIKNLQASLQTPAIMNDPNQVAQVGAKIKAVEGLLAQEAFSIEKTLNGVRAGFQAAGIVAGFLGHDKLAGDIMVVGEAAIALAGSIATIVAGSAVGGPAMPILAICGTVVALAVHFLGSKSGPSPEEVILKQINELSKHMDTRFDRIEIMIQRGVEYLAEHMDRRILALSEHLDGRFERIEITLNYMYKDMLKEFAQLNTHVNDVRIDVMNRLVVLQQSVDRLHIMVRTGLRDIFDQQYKTTQNAALTPIARDRIGDDTHRDNYRRIVDRIHTESKVSLHTEGDPSLLGEASVSLCINTLRQRAMFLTANAPTITERVSDPAAFVNPSVWSEGVRTLMAYFALTPKLYQLIYSANGPAIKPILDDLAQIIREGERVHQFMTRMQKSQFLFNQLIDNYAAALRTVVRNIYRLSITPEGNIGTPSANPDAALRRVLAIEACGEDFVDTEMTPPRGNVPDMTRLDRRPITAFAGGEAFPTNAVAAACIAAFACNLRDIHNRGFYHNDDAYQNAISQNHHAGWIRRQTNVEGRWDGFQAGWVNSIQESTAIKAVAIQYRDFINATTSADAKLRSDGNYRNQRIRAVIFHHAVVERDRAAQTGELPHRALMEKYFSLRDRAGRNNLLTGAAFDQTVELENLQKALNELYIFIAFAFPRQFTDNPTMGAFLGTLWNKQMIVDHIAAGTRPKDFIAVALQKTLEPGREVDCFRAHLIGQVEAAKLTEQMGIETSEYTHPLIATILGELHVFQEAAQLALAAPAQAASVRSTYHPLGSYTVPDSDSEMLLAALNHQLSYLQIRLTRLPHGSEVEQITQVARDNNLEVVVVDDCLNQISSIHTEGRRATIHLLNTSQNRWYSFEPSQACRDSSKYKAARIVGLPPASDLLSDLQSQVSALDDMLGSIPSVSVSQTAGSTFHQAGSSQNTSASQASAASNPGGSGL